MCACRRASSDTTQSQKDWALFKSYASKNVDRLEEEHKCLETFENELLGVARLLAQLPAKVEHEILVPFGPIAFFPGRLVHTNEVKTCIGDDYYVHWTTPQARANVERRLQFVAEGKEEKLKNIKSIKERIGLSASTLAAEYPATAEGEEMPVEETLTGKGSVRKTAEGFIEIMERLSDDDDNDGDGVNGDGEPTELQSQSDLPSNDKPAVTERPVSSFKAKRAAQKR
eukprot:Lankesteria_metandrocarpae@DN6279_c0_g1_i1.p2